MLMTPTNAQRVAVASSEFGLTTPLRKKIIGVDAAAKPRSGINRLFQVEIIMSVKPTTPTINTVTMVDAIDEAYSHVCKLEALLQNTYSECGPTFRNLNDATQDSYLWACADLAKSIKDALEASFSIRRQP